VPVPPACAGLPDRDAPSSAPPPRLAPAEHSEDQRARVEGPSEGRVPCAHATISRACDGCMRLIAHADGVPLLGVLRTSAVIGAPLASGRYPLRWTDRPRPSFRRRPAKSAAFQKTRMPSTITSREGIFRRGGIAPSGLRAGSPAHAAHTLSPRFARGQCFLMGIARSRCGHPRVRELRECRHLFYPLGLPCLGLTTQARQRARPTRPSTRTDCLARTGAGRSA